MLANKNDDMNKVKHVWQANKIGTEYDRRWNIITRKKINKHIVIVKIELINVMKFKIIFIIDQRSIVFINKIK